MWLPLLAKFQLSQQQPVAQVEQCLSVLARRVPEVLGLCSWKLDQEQTVALAW
jgi:hypothetical protein